MSRLKISMPSKKYRQMFGGGDATPAPAPTPAPAEATETESTNKDVVDMDGNLILLIVQPVCWHILILVDTPSSNKANQILFLKNLPEETTAMMLSMLFNQYVGKITS